MHEHLVELNMYASSGIRWALVGLFQFGRYYYPTAVQVTPARAATVPVATVAGPVLPQVQQNVACVIIAIKGLGSLDGDYSMLENLLHGGKPSWIGTSPDTQDFLLSWKPLEHLWTIGNRNTGLYHAFVPAEEEISPPGQSSRWWVFDSRISDFREVSRTVTVYCPACTVATVSDLVYDDLSACNGPYHLVDGIGEEIFVWMHVAEEGCMYFHDRTGRAAAITTSESLIEECIGGVGVATGSWNHEMMAQGFGCSRRILADIDQMMANTTLLHRKNARVTCTSAGSTTRLVFGLGASHAQHEAHEAQESESKQSRKYRYTLSSTQEGLVICSAQGYVHISVSFLEPLAFPEAGHGKDEQDLPLDWLSGGSHLNVCIAVDGEELVTGMPLQTAREKGVLVSMHGLEGTHAIQLCLRDHEDSQQLPAIPIPRWLEGHSCLTDTVLTLEAFPAESHVVLARSMKAPTGSSLMTSSAMKPTVHTQGRKQVLDDAARVRVTFVLDLEVVDGYKLSSLHLMKHLPKNFEGSALDLSCSSGPVPMKQVFEKEAIPVIRLCIMLPRKGWEAMHRGVGGVWFHLYSALMSARSWGEVTEHHPSVSRALAPLHDYLVDFDVLVMSNGAKDDDAYLLQLARLSAVNARVVNLGPITGGYLSPLFDGATAFVSPSHYVAHKPAVSRHAAGLSVKVCHPVMDASRILVAARACPPRDDHTNVTTVGSSTFAAFSSRSADGSSDSSAVFVMVGRLSSYKTPGMFVRAMSILQRRGAGPVQGHLIGTGPLLEYLEQLASYLDAAVRFTGFMQMDDVPCEVMRATALVLPSLSLETFGMVAPEAMILGVPVITFGFGGTGELVRHMENGVVVHEPTPRALADAMELLARDRRLRDRLGTQARLDASRAMVLPHMVQCHLDAFASQPGGEEKERQPTAVPGSTPCCTTESPIVI